MGRGLGIVLIGTIGVGVAYSHASAVSASEAPSRARSHVLIFHDEDKSLPGLAVLDRSLRDSFQAGLGGGVEFYSEALGLSQFERAGYDRLVVDFYGPKYSSKKVDLIVAVMEPSLDFLLRHGEALFPGVPIVFCGVDAATIEGKTLRANITGVLVRREFAPTLEAALRLQPNIRNVFVVRGASRSINSYSPSSGAICNPSKAASQ